MKKFSIGILVLVALFALSTMIMVDETEQIVILQFGKPVRAGIKLEISCPVSDIQLFRETASGI